MNHSLKNFVIATPDDSLTLTGEQATALYEELGQHLRQGSETDGALPMPRAAKHRKHRASKPE